jgi:cobalt/nickel transport system permease protein
MIRPVRMKAESTPQFGQQGRQSASQLFAPQTLLLTALMLVLAIVIGAPQNPFSVGTVVVLILALSLGLGLSLRRVLLRSLFVIPVAGFFALAMPLRYVGQWELSAFGSAYASHWPELVNLILTPWLCLLVMLSLAELCSQGDLLCALERLHLPRALTLLLNFMYRYVGLLRHQLLSMHRALVARAPGLTRRKQVLLYGNIGGNMLIRAYDRGERIHAAMSARGFTGILPRPQCRRFGKNDVMLLCLFAVFSTALVLV